MNTIQEIIVQHGLPPIPENTSINRYVVTLSEQQRATFMALYRQLPVISSPAEQANAAETKASLALWPEEMTRDDVDRLGLIFVPTQTPETY